MPDSGAHMYRVFIYSTYFRSTSSSLTDDIINVLLQPDVPGQMHALLFEAY